ncbi:MAG TPA: hypothetical protein VIO16_15210 [Dehalococcoidia bacterium]
MKSIIIAIALLAATDAAQASDRACYRAGFVCDCTTGVCEGGAVMPMALAQNQSQRGMAQPKQPTLEDRVQRLERAEAERNRQRSEELAATARRSR